jgi:hypothetical protein
MRKDRGGQTARQLRRRKARNLLLTWSLVLVVVLVLISAVGYYYIMNLPKSQDPRPEIVDATGVKSVSSDGSLSFVRFTLRNNGTGTIDLMKVSLQFKGPKTQTVLYLDKAAYSTASKEDFGVSGSGNPSEGWDPANGKFLVKGTTLATLIVDLRATGGINDQLGPHDTIKVTVTIEEGPGSGSSGIRSFSVPADLGSGTFIALHVL